jgi:hypothetical protein
VDTGFFIPSAGLIPKSPPFGGGALGRFSNVLLYWFVWVLNPHRIHTYRNDDTPLLAAGRVILSVDIRKGRFLKMKKQSRHLIQIGWLTTFCIVLFYLVVLCGCDTGNSGDEKNILKDTDWEGTIEQKSVTLSFSESSYELGYTKSYLYQKGGYSFSDGKITFICKEGWDGTKWVADNQTFYGTVSGNKITLEDGTTFIKKE